MQDAERVFDCLIIGTADRDSLAPYADAIAILAKKHAVPEALIHSRDLGRQMEDAGGKKQPLGPVNSAFPRSSKPSSNALTPVISSSANCTS